MNSFKKMILDKTIKRRDDGMYMQLKDIHVRDGFNQRVESQQLQEENDSLLAFILSGGQVPPIEVSPRDDGGVWIVEGHRRNLAYNRAVESGAPIEWVNITPFKGNDVEATARILNSNSQLKLTPYEQSLVVKKLAGFNLTPAQIAQHVNMSRSKVDYLLEFSAAPHQVKEMVKSGEVALTVSVEQMKKHGESVGDVLSEKVEEARKSGVKVTSSSIEKPFSATKARRLVELLSDAELDDEGNGYSRRIVVFDSSVKEIMQIIKEYNEGK